jgi:hypothetical protein
MDRKRIQTELGVTRAVVDQIFRTVPVVQFPGSRKPHVRRTDVLNLIERSTWQDDGKSVQPLRKAT